MATPLDLTAFISPVTDITDAITAAAPTVLGSVAVVTGGLLMFGLGVRLVKRFAK